MQTNFQCSSFAESLQPRGLLCYDGRVRTPPPPPPAKTKKKRKKDKEKAENSIGRADGSGNSWGTLKRLSKDRTTWRSFVTALNVDRRYGSN